MRDQAAEASVAAFANKMTVAGGGTALVGGLAASDLVAFGGLFTALAGLAINYYYKHKADKREQADRAERRAEHEARLKSLQERE